MLAWELGRKPSVSFLCSISNSSVFSPDEACLSSLTPLPWDSGKLHGRPSSFPYCGPFYYLSFLALPHSFVSTLIPTHTLSQDPTAHI